MIASFGDRATEDLYHGRKSKTARGLPADIVSVAVRKLDMVNRLPQLRVLRGLKMIPRNRVPTHPGEVLQDEFLVPLGLTQVRLAEHVGVPVQRINEIIRRKRGITPETAWLFAPTSLEFQSNRQASQHGRPGAGSSLVPCLLRELEGRWREARHSRSAAQSQARGPRPRAHVPASRPLPR